MRTRKQSGVRRILKVYKECTRVSAVKTRSQNSARNNNMFICFVVNINKIHRLLLKLEVIEVSLGRNYFYRFRGKSFIRPITLTRIENSTNLSETTNFKLSSLQKALFWVVS